jgi:DNA (cytosine-5)-methyltransferase 1
LGYGWAYRVLDAQWFGVAQRRRRVFVIGYLGDWRRAAQVLFERESVRRDTAPSREKGQETAQCLTTGVGKRYDAESETLPVTFGAQMSVPQTDVDLVQTLQAKNPMAVAHPVHYRKSRRAQSTTDHETWVEDDATNTLNCFDVGDVRATDVVAQPITQFGNIAGSLTARHDSSPCADRGQNVVAQPVAFTRCDNGQDAAINVTPTMRCGSNYSAHLAVAQPIAPTLTATNDPSRSPQSSEVTQQVEAVHSASMQVRRLTPVECERLQGFPDNYTNIPWRKGTESPDGPRYKALGNSMAVPVMAWIGKRIKQVDE